MKKTAIILISILVAGMFVACNQDVTVDAQVYANMEVGTFVLNGKNYDTLQAAVDAIGSKAAGDNVIYLTRHASGPGAKIANKDVTIDFQGYTYSFTNVTGLQGVDVTGKDFGLSITSGSDVVLKGMEKIDLNDKATTDLTMVYVEGKETKLAIESAPKMVVEPDQYVFWAANGASLTIGGKDASESATVTGKVAATGTALQMPTVTVQGATNISGAVEATSANIKMDDSAKVTGAIEVSNTQVIVDGDSKIAASLRATDSANVTINSKDNVITTLDKTSNSTVTITETIKVEEVSSGSEDSTIVIAGDDSVQVVDEAGTQQTEMEDRTTQQDAVAVIGKTFYVTLDAAVAAAQSGDTVKLLQSVDYTDSIGRLSAYEVSVETGVTLDLNGKEIKMRNKAIVFTGDSFTIKNGTFTASPRGSYDSEYTGETINDSYALFIGSKDTAKNVVLENLVLNGGLNVSHGSTVTVQGEKTKINGTKYYAVWAQGKSVVTLKNGIYSLATEGVVKTASLPDPNPVLSVGKGETVDVDLDYCGTIVVEGGIFTVPSSIPGKDSARSSKLSGIGDGGAAKTNIAIKGGTFNVDPSDYVAEGYEANDNGDGTWTVVEKDPVAMIGEVKYFTLQSAVAAVKEGETIVVLKDISVSDELNIDKSFVLSLNGHTITGTKDILDSKLFNVSSGTLTIDGTVENSTINAKAILAAVSEKAELIVNGGTYSNSHITYKDDKPNDGNYVFDIKGTAELNDITLSAVVKGIRAKGTGASVTIKGSNSVADVTPCWGLFCSDNASLTIEDGNYTTTYSKQQQMIDIKKDGLVTIKGGSFTTKYTDSGDAPALVVFNSGNNGTGDGDRLVINGGEFKYSGNLGYINSSKHQKISITGGILDASSIVVDGVNGEVLEYAITGGTFHTNPSAHVAPLYTAVENKPSEGWWTVESIFDGSGTEDDPYILDGIDAWMELVHLCENDLTFANTNGKYFKMTDDVDVSSKTERANVDYFAGCIDFDNHSISGFNHDNTVDDSDDGNTAIFKYVGYDVKISNLNVYTSVFLSYPKNKPCALQLIYIVPSSVRSNTNVTIENVDFYGNAVGFSNNNTGLYCAYAWMNSLLIKDCNNYANLMTNMYVSAFIGSYRSTVPSTITFNNCKNYGTIISTGSTAGASMLVANPTNRGGSNNTYFTVVGCSNEGMIATPAHKSLLMPVGEDSMPYTPSNYARVYLNEVEVNKSGYSTEDKITVIKEAFGSQMTGNQVVNLNVNTLGVTDGKFDLETIEGAIKYSLMFSFTATNHNGGGAGYKVDFTDNLPTDLNVSKWVDLQTKTGDVSVLTLPEGSSGTLYVDALGQYVFTEEGSGIYGKVFVSFVAFGSNNEILSISTYQYE